MQLIEDRIQMTAARAQLAERGGRVALVPTMGALHEGHLALVRAARARAAHTIVSIFVNPLQFGPNEDFGRYPRTRDADVALLRAEGVYILWAPTVDAMYPEGFATAVHVGSIGNKWCGAVRPGHFDGVATVVSILFGQTRPDLAVFGEKDWQQLTILRRTARDLALGVEMIGLPTVREPDGLALSSRNRYLTPDQRAQAACLPHTLGVMRARLIAGDGVDVIKSDARAEIIAAGFTSIDYLELIDGDTLEPVMTPVAGARLIVAAWLGATRLIDNIAVAGPPLV